MGKKRKELSPMDALFQELGRLSRDGKADEALLAFDRAKADLSGPFEPRVYHKLLALTVGGLLVLCCRRRGPREMPPEFKEGLIDEAGVADSADQPVFRRSNDTQTGES